MDDEIEILYEKPAKRRCEQSSYSKVFYPSSRNNTKENIHNGPSKTSTDTNFSTGKPTGSYPCSSTPFLTIWNSSCTSQNSGTKCGNNNFTNYSILSNLPKGTAPKNSFKNRRRKRRKRTFHSNLIYASRIPWKSPIESNPHVLQTSENPFLCSTRDLKQSSKSLLKHDGLEIPKTIGIASGSNTKVGYDQPIKVSNPISHPNGFDRSKQLTKVKDLNNGKSSSYFIVVDTNIFIHQLKSLDEIKDIPINNCGPPHIFIPWVVIQELDRLKKSRYSDIFKYVTNAVKYINRFIKSKDSRFQGQSPLEVKSWAREFSMNNDDRILECCFSLSDKISRDKVILLTNDINLVNKALVSNLRGYDMKSFLKFIKLELNTLIKNNANPVQSEFPKFNVENRKVTGMMTSVRQLLKRVLLQFLEAEMMATYGGRWRKFNINIHLLKDILNTIEVYWQTSFSLKYSIKDKRNFDLLRVVFNRSEDLFRSRQDCFETFKAIEEVLLCIGNRLPAIKIPIKHIINIRNLIFRNIGKEL